MSERRDVQATSARHIAAIKPILELLASHVSDAPSFGQLAAMAGMSRSHFSRTFHAVVGVPLRRYVSDLRLKRACGLLEASTLSLTNIAQECGFYDLPHLDKAFRRRFDMSPNGFRHRGRELARLRGGKLLEESRGFSVSGAITRSPDVDFGMTGGLK